MAVVDSILGAEYRLKKECLLGLGIGIKYLGAEPEPDGFCDVL
jgi:hypothetical protein